MKKHIIAAAIALASASAQAQWSEPALANDGSWYVSTDSTDTEGTFFGLYMDQNCEITAIQGMISAGWEYKESSWETRMETRIDRNPVWYKDDALMVLTQEDDGNGKYNFLRVGLGVGDKMLAEIATGSKLITRAQRPDDSWSGTVTFNLRGSSRAITKLTSKCGGGGDEWGDTDAAWRSNRSENEWSS